jgi:hypothetical protein
LNGLVKKKELAREWEKGEACGLGVKSFDSKKCGTFLDEMCN